MTMLCRECSEELGYWNVKLLEDLDFSRKGLYCSHCYPVALQQLQKLRFIEEYKGYKIYCKDGKYSPYWGSWYYFKSIEDTRIRIDNQHVAVVNREMLRMALSK